MIVIIWLINVVIVNTSHILHIVDAAKNCIIYVGLNSNCW